MLSRTLTTAGALIALFASMPATAVSTATFNAGFSANESLWSGGPSAGFDESGGAGVTAAGISYSAVANSGTVRANVNGQIQATYDEYVDTPNSATTVRLQFNGGSSNVSSQLGANANVSGYVNFCALRNPFTGNCITRVDPTFDLLDEGLLLDPSRDFTANLGVASSASDADSAVGFGPNLDLVVGELGAEVNLDLDQTIRLTPSGIDGVLSYTNRNTGQNFLSPFIMGVLDMVEVTTAELGGGIWDFSLLGIDLLNSFRNDIDLELRPTINYIFGEWPAPGASPLSISLIDETFALDFTTLNAVDLFSIEVAAVPLPAAFWLFGSALVGFIGYSRRRSPG